MGGGDLNTKKSWHPSTLKNQERVWKAEQAEAQEKKRILELQRERDEAHERAQLNDMAQRNFGGGGAQAADNRLHWMYDKPDKKAQHEDYLLGKEIGKTDDTDKVQNAIPAVSRRVVGSSMTKSLDDTQVDLTRKLREDPLLLVKERERAARAALLNNPLQRKRLAELLRKEKEQKESKQKEGKTKKKSKKKNKNLDDMLAAKLNALGDKGIDLSSLLNSNDSSSDSSDSEKPKEKKKKKKDKKKKKKKKKSSNSDTDLIEGEKHEKKQESYDRYQRYPRNQSPNRSLKLTKDNDDRKSGKSYESHHKDYINREVDDDRRKKYERSYDNSKHQSSKRYNESRKRRSNSPSHSDDEMRYKKTKRENEESNRKKSDKYKQCDSSERRDRFEMSSAKKDVKEKRQGMSEAEKAAKLAEMMAAGKERETERGMRVARQRAEDAAAESSRRLPRAMDNEARALPDSLESRIRSNRHNIQRDKTHMNQNFARR